jgi:hypothetical protein
MSGRFQLVLQFDARTSSDIDELVEIENRLIETLGDSAVVDGHDFGSGEFNIFIVTNDPHSIFQMALVGLGPSLRREMRSGYRETSAEVFTPLWPPGLREFTVA